MAQHDSIQRPSSPPNGPVDWPALLAAHGRWLRTVLLARLGEPVAVEDVLAEVQATAVEKGHLLRDPAKAAPWLYRVAVASALEYRRRVGRKRKLLVRFAEQFPPTEHDPREPDPLDWLIAKERQALVRQALACLPRREAEILLLKYTEDWTYQHIADHLGLSTSAVEARLHRARGRMRKALGRLDPALVTLSRDRQ